MASIKINRKTTSLTGYMIALFVVVSICVIMWRLMLIPIHMRKNVVCPDGQVCMSQSTFEQLQSTRVTALEQPFFNPTNTNTDTNTHTNKNTNTNTNINSNSNTDTHTNTHITLDTIGNTRERDLRVLNDPLYPAYNRTDSGTFNSVFENTLKRNINVPTQRYHDSYRLIGYLINNNDEIGRWKVFGKQRERNIGDFYMTPVDKTQDMKIQITDSIVMGQKLKDIDNIPDELVFKTPLLAPTPYKFTELPKADLTDIAFM